MEQFSRGIHFFKKFKMIHDKIVGLDKIFERKFNFWYFYESFWLTKIVRFQILSKNIEFQILFFRDAYSNSHSCSWLFLAQHLQLRVTKVFMGDINTSCFSPTLAKIFLVRIFLYDVNQSYFLPISAKFFL